MAVRVEGTTLPPRIAGLRLPVVDVSTLVYLPLLIVVAFNFLTLLPELTLASPSLNDDVYHLALVQRATEVISGGGNPIDFWLPNLNLGFPSFTYYQHLPHLFVAALAALTGIRAFDAFNATRVVLMAGFPITVYWSTRRLGLAREEAVCASAACSLFSGGWRYGFEYESYLWRGFGMYTQLWAMHLSFLALACVGVYLDSGRGRLRAVVLLSMLVLSHLVYAYMMAITLGLFLLARGRDGAIARARRLLLTGALTALITSYMWLPFLRASTLLNASPNLAGEKYDSFGAEKILGWLFSGDLIDRGRLPVLTVLVGIGVLSAVRRRTPPERLALLIFGAWLLLYFGRPTWGGAMDLLPLHHGLLLHRFIGSVGIGAILLIGLGGGVAWRFVAGRLQTYPALSIMAPALLMCIAIYPAVQERNAFYAQNALWLRQSNDFIGGNEDAARVVQELKELPPGRVFAGINGIWDQEMKVGFVNMSDLLLFNGLDVFAPTFDASLNGDALWYMDPTSASMLDLFNVRYVVAPTSTLPSPLWRPLLETRQYVLYETTASGYFAIGRTDAALTGSQADFHDAAIDWLMGAGPRLADYPIVDLLGRGNALGFKEQSLQSWHPTSNELTRPGTVISQEAGKSRYDALVQLDSEATVVLKVTYHPGWRAWVDGERVTPFAVMPSMVGVSVPMGEHDVRLQYVSDGTKTWLLLLGGLTLLGVVLAGRIQSARMSGGLPGAPQGVT